MDTIRGKFLKQHLLSDEFLDLIEKNKRPMDELMSYYQCAIMEVETKFKVLNQEYPAGAAGRAPPSPERRQPAGGSGYTPAAEAPPGPPKVPIFM